MTFRANGNVKFTFSFVQEYRKIILVFMTNAKRLTFIWKRHTVSGKLGENMVKWSLIPFALNAMLNLPITYCLSAFFHS